MFSYAKNKLETFWRTKSSLMIVLRRRLRDAIRLQEELEKERIPAIEEAEKAGEVERVDRELEGIVFVFEREMELLVKGEKLAIEAEDRPLEEFAKMQTMFKRAVNEMHELHQRSNPAVRQILSKAVEKLLELQKKLDRLASEDADVLKQEYNALLRSEKHERGSMQNLVFSINEVMELMKKAWEERSETREATRDAKEVFSRAQRAIGKIHEIDEEIKKLIGDKTRSGGRLTPPAIRLLKRKEQQISKEVQHIEQGVNLLMTHLHEVIENFLFIFKVMADLELHYQALDESHVEKILADLERTGFPQNNLQTLKVHYAHAKANNHAALETGVDAFRRMARLETDR